MTVGDAGWLGGEPTLQRITSIPTDGSPDAALAIFEFIDEMRAIILAVYGTHIQHASRQRWQSTPAEPLVIPDDELPF
jgi:hypothetical protein